MKVIIFGATGIVGAGALREAPGGFVHASADIDRSGA